jgi:hypothetical protein
MNRAQKFAKAVSSVRRVLSRGLCSNRTWDKLDAVNEVPGNSDKGWSAAHSAHHARVVYRGGPLNVVFLD